MNKSIANWNYLCARIEKDLFSNLHQLPAKVILIQRIGFFFFFKKIIMNKSSSLLLHLHLHLHLLHFLIMNKSSYFKKKKNQFFLNLSKKKKKEIFKKALGLGALGSYLLGCFQKKIINQNFQFLEKIQDFQIFQKKKKKIINQNFQFQEKIQDFRIFQKKKIIKSLLNSSSWTESYDPLPYFPVVQHQVNCPPSAFFEAWNMSQTRGICQVCRILFNE